MLYANREKFKRVGVYLGKIFSKILPSPNAWTIFGLIPAIISFYYIINQEFLLAALFFAIMSIVDLIDGSVARETRKVTKFGAYLDTVVDRIAEFIILLGIFMTGYHDFVLPVRTWVFILLFSSLMTTYVKAAAFEKKIVKKELKGGLLERGERLLLLFVIILVSSYNPMYASIIIAITAILSLVSFLQRFLIAMKQSDFK